ncbi:hypothetical protein [Nocardia pseudovaccinii]|uniref:hypothetical protein n=1 Tax=Nocardia pseudovaccinii TaxID=189540 RepID=UPI0007A3C7B4|nr:hypothetical protein [Nocardia pseudovaccinii]
MTTRDERSAQLHRLTKQQLIAKCRTGIERPDSRVVEFLGESHRAWTRDELITRILEIQFAAEGDCR